MKGKTLEVNELLRDLFGVKGYRVTAKDLLTGNFDSDVSNLHEAIRRNPYNSHPYVGLGDVYCKAKQYDQAITWYKKAIAVNPHSAAPLIGLGNVCCHKKEYDKAVYCYEQAAAIDSRPVSPYLALALFLRDGMN